MDGSSGDAASWRAGAGAGGASGSLRGAGGGPEGATVVVGTAVVVVGATMLEGAASGSCGAHGERHEANLAGGPPADPAQAHTAPAGAAQLPSSAPRTFGWHYT